ncbi:thiamine pyrophosphate enzyme, N-terminal TPP binding domain protein [Mycobacterium kansasii 732]|nr:thiamine pyrophosphate enzyme, N-terminal TPP binding domain protein [Mycobacterium kansasii 732]
MNGAQALISTLVDGGVDVCFANPGTSEMHFVAALDTVPQMRGILTLFEGVATGAADGYARIADRPAAVLLHLGPGLGNGLANLHNARRARVPIVVVVGDHATYHKKYDAPLESDIDALAGTVSGWVRRTQVAADVGTDTADAVAASRWGPQISTLILPADASWSDGAAPGATAPERPAPAGTDLASVADVLRSGEPVMLLIGGNATRGPGWPRPRGSPTPLGPAGYVRRFRPGWSAAPACPPWSASRTSRKPPRHSWTGPSIWCWPAPSRRCRFSPTPACPAIWCRPGVRCTSSPIPGERRRR